MPRASRWARLINATRSTQVGERPEKLARCLHVNVPSLPVLALNGGALSVPPDDEVDAAVRVRAAAPRDDVALAEVNVGDHLRLPPGWLSARICK